MKTLFLNLCSDITFSKKILTKIVEELHNVNVDLAAKLCSDKDFPREEIPYILSQTRQRNVELAKLMYDEKFPPKHMGDALLNAVSTSINVYNRIKNYPNIPMELKTKIIATGREDLIDAIPKLLNQYNIMLRNPQKYVNGEMSDEEAARNVKFFVESSMKDMLFLSDSLDKEALDNLFRRRLDNVRVYVLKTRGFEPQDYEVLKQLNNACNINGKPLMPTQKVEAIDLIQSYKDCGLDVSKLMPKDGKIDLGGAKIELFSHVMELAGLTKEEIAQIPKEKLVAWDTTYAHLMAQEVDEPAMRDLLRAANFDDFERYIHDESNEYGKANARTQKLFRTQKMNYDAWLHPDKSLEINFRSMDKNQEKLLQVSKQLVEDIETLRQNPAVSGFIDKQFPKCIKEGQFIIPTENMTSKEKLSEFTNNVLKQLEGVWKRAENNAQNENVERETRARNTLTIRDHLNQRLDDISKIEKVESTKSFDVTIKMWDRIPQKDIFQGNYSTCCIAMGGGNGSAMPHYLLNTAYNMIELVDNNTGKTIGNALCYFVTGSDGKSKFIIDNIEIKDSAKPSNDVGIALRQQITNYADAVAREVTGRDDIEIFMSAKYNDVLTDDLKAKSDEISFLGGTDCDEIYMDLYGGWVRYARDDDGNRTQTYTRFCTLLKLTPDKPTTTPVKNSVQQYVRHELAAMKIKTADGTANPRFAPTEIENLVTKYTYKDKDGKIQNNAENIAKLLKLDKYKDLSAEEIGKIAEQYDKNLGDLVALGNIPEVNSEILGVKASDSYKIVERIERKTADGETKILEVKKLNREVEEQLRIAAKQLRSDALGVEKSIAEFMEANKLTTEGYKFSHRSKSLSSLFDKLKNYLLDPNNSDKTVQDAINSVKDAVGTRTIIPTRDYTQHPEVKALVAKGDREGAVKLAMKLQVEEIIQNLTKLLTKLKADGVENIGVVRFSNYMGTDGMPYISANQLLEIKKLIDVEFDNLTDDKKAVFISHGIELKSEHFETTERKSGYTAFQANFKTKDGYVFEWQFRGEKVNVFAEAEHVPYDLRTDKDIISANPKAKEILEPIRDILSVEKMTDDDFAEYNKYLTAYYKYCREIELGFTDAKLEYEFNIEKFDPRLRAENLILLHEYCDLIRKAPESDIPRLIAKYKSKLIN